MSSVVRAAGCDLLRGWCAALGESERVRGRGGERGRGRGRKEKDSTCSVTSDIQVLQPDHLHLHHRSTKTMAVSPHLVTTRAQVMLCRTHTKTSQAQLRRARASAQPEARSPQCEFPATFPFRALRAYVRGARGLCCAQELRFTGDHGDRFDRRGEHLRAVGEGEDRPTGRPTARPAELGAASVTSESPFPPLSLAS